MAQASVKISAATSEYKAAMKEAAQSMKDLTQEYSLASAKAKLLGSAKDELRAKSEALTGKISAQKDKIQANSEYAEKLTQHIKNLTNKNEELKAKITEAEAALQKSVETTGKDSEETQKLQKELDELKSKLDSNESALENNNEKLKNVEKSTKLATAELDNMETELQQVSDKLKNVDLDKLADGMQKTGEKIEGAGEKMMGVTTAITGVMTVSATMATSFETSMAKVGTIMDETEVSLDDMETAILDLSNQTGISANEIADNVYNAISAGQSTGEAVNFVTQATKLATAGFAESADTIDILSTIMNAYGLEASEVTKVSDMLVQTQNKGKTTVAELSSAMGKVIPTANANSVALDQLCTGYALMTANGVATAETTTYMNSMLNELGKTGSKTDKILREETGKSFQELMAGGASLADVLEIVDGAAKEQNLTMSDMFGSAEAAKAGLILLGDSADTFNTALKDMNNSTGATEAGFNKMADTTEYKAKQSLQKLKNTAIDLGNSVLTVEQPAIDKFSSGIQKLSDWFKGLDDNQKQTIVTIGLVVAAIAPTLIIVGKLVTGIGSAIKAFQTIKTAITAAKTAFTTAKVAVTALSSGALLPIIGVIAAVVAAGVLLYKNWDTVKAYAQQLWAKIKEVFAGVKTTISNAWDSVKTKTTSVINGVKSTVSSGFNAVKTAITTPLNAAKSTVSGILDSIKNGFSNKLNAAKSVVSNAISAIKSKFNFSWSLPKLKLPHVSISGSFSLVPPKVPKFYISWYKAGGIMTNPTIFGAAGNTLLGGGEAGAEAILPLASFYNRLNAMLDNKIGKLAMAGGVAVYVYNELDGEEIASKQTKKVVKQISAQEQDKKIFKGE